MKELKGKCKYCLYKCGRVEERSFKGTNNCKYYIKPKFLIIRKIINWIRKR